MKTILLGLLIIACSYEAHADETLIKVKPGSPRETFIIGAQAISTGDQIKITFTIQPRTTKDTLPFDCLLSVDDRTCGWRIKSPCFDSIRKQAAKEEISVTVQKAELKKAYFEFRYNLKTIDKTEIWRMQLADYENGAKPE